MSEKMGLYIHIPFCASKCPYCDFYSVKYSKELAEDYANKLILKMKDFDRSYSFDTVYFGGGTPSILEPKLLCSILDNAKNHFNIDEKSEITVECNPSKDLKEDFKIYKKHGINRISLGMQSAVKNERLALGRRAGQAEVQKAVFDAKKAGITNISLDLMLGTPKQTINSLDETFDFIKKMDVTHISAYMLKIEKETPFFKLQDKLDLPSNDEVSNMYLKTVSKLEEMGLFQYEISNFAKPSFESHHNIKYWNLTNYLGIGKSAHSFIDGKRFYFDKEFNKVDDGIGGTLEEKIMLGLRLKKGIDISLLNDNYKDFVKMGYMEIKGNKISFTPKGFLVSNTIISELI